jgi:hypothetical protein
MRGRLALRKRFVRDCSRTARDFAKFFECLTEAAPKIYFNLALFVCPVVIKCANEDIGDRDHESISRSIISVPAFMRSTPCAFAQRMC